MSESNNEQNEPKPPSEKKVVLKSEESEKIKESELKNIETNEDNEKQVVKETKNNIEISEKKESPISEEEIDLQEEDFVLHKKSNVENEGNSKKKRQINAIKERKKRFKDLKIDTNVGRIHDSVTHSAQVGKSHSYSQLPLHQILSAKPSSFHSLSHRLFKMKTNEENLEKPPPKSSPHIYTRPKANVHEIREKLNKYVHHETKRFLLVGLDFECNIYETFEDLLTMIKYSFEKHQHNKTEIEPFWIDVQSPSDSDMSEIEKYFNLHVLTTEDCRDQDSGEKWELYPNYLFVCVRTVDKQIENDFEELNILVFKRFVITIHKGFFEELEMILKRIETEFETDLTEEQKRLLHLSNIDIKYDVERVMQKIQPTIVDVQESSESDDELPSYIRKNKKTRKSFQGVKQKLTKIPSPCWILYAFVDAMTDMYVPLTEELMFETENIDELILELTSNHEKMDLLRRLGNVKKKITRMKKLLTVKHSIVLLLMSNMIKFITKETSLYFRDVVDHITQCSNLLENAKEGLNQSHSNYMIKVSIEIAKSSKQTDTIMNRITLFASVITPLALISAIWGMNCPVPGQYSTDLWWFFGIIAGMFIVSLFSVVMLSPQLIPLMCRGFRRKKWKKKK